MFLALPRAPKGMGGMMVVSAGQLIVALIEHLPRAPKGMGDIVVVNQPRALIGMGVMNSTVVRQPRALRGMGAMWSTGDLPLLLRSGAVVVVSVAGVVIVVDRCRSSHKHRASCGAVLVRPARKRVR